jgi:hypothetical protein
MRRLLATAAAVILVGALSYVPAEAATPAGGSISDTSPTVTWTAGPFLVANDTGLLGDPTCSAATPCDDFTLTVTTPAGYGDGHLLRIQVSWPISAADFDVYVLDSSGAIIGSAASSSDPETLLLPPTSGVYTVRVVPFAPLGQSITGTASLVDKPVNPPPSSVPAPGFGAYAAPADLDGHNDAGEPSIGVNWKTGAVMYQAGRTTFRVSFDATGAATWVDRSAPTAVTSLDPILFTDHVTGRTFESQLLGKTSLMEFTDDDGDTWLPSQGGGINSGVDHQSVGGGPFAPAAVGPLTAYPHAVYYCSQDIADALCALSRDGGLTFGPAVPIYTLLECGGLHGHVKVAPDGTVYVPNKGCGGNQAVAVSPDNGLTWTVRKHPGSTVGDTDPSVGIGANGTVYFGYHNGDGHARIGVSHDKGLTWIRDQDVGAQLGLQNIVFPAVVAGDDDRAAFAFLGTTTPGNYQDPSFTGVWHLYVSVTYDGGVSWKTVDVTPSDPVQRGSICTSGTTCGEDRNLLDFMDVTIDKQGRVLVGFADGCVAACVATGPNSFTAWATIARQTSGLTLFSLYDQAQQTKKKHK